MSGSRGALARPRRAATWAAAVVIVVGLVGVPFASNALAATTSQSQEKFRASLGSYMENLQGALTAASRNAQTRAVVAPHLKANLKALAVAKNNLSNLNSVQLEAMQRILGLDPAWADQPNALRQDLSDLSTTQSAPTSPSSTPAGYLSDCTDTNLGEARGLFYSYWAAAQAASVANAVATAIPTGDEYEAGLIAGGVAYGVTNGLAIGLNDRLARKLDCLTAASNATLVSAYPVDPGTGAYTRASSQVSVNTLTDLAGDIDGTLDTIELVINSTTSKLSTVINNLGLAKGNTDAIQATAMDLQTRATDLLGSVGTPTDQATYSGSDPSGTANGLANTIDTRQDTALASTASVQTLSVRLQIEESLADQSSNPSVALFALPASQGGYLETVRDIATTTIVNELAAGQTINGDAQEDLGEGNDALAAGKYEQAFQLYGEAYRHAVG